MEKVILVTGSSRGIGRAIVEFLAENREYKLILNYNKSLEKAEEIKSNLQEKGIEIDIVKADVLKKEEVNTLIDFIIEKYGKIDVIVNNAGIDQEKLLQDIEEEEFEEVINVNLKSVFLTSKKVIPYMLKQGKGAIINISSIYGVTGGSYASMYSASKAGIDGLTKSLSKELGSSNIRVNSIAPGCINTDMTKGYSKEELDQIKENTPLNRIGEGIDIARCVKWLIEDEFTTGQVIVIDGGYSIK